MPDHNDSDIGSTSARMLPVNVKVLLMSVVRIRRVILGSIEISWFLYVINNKNN